MDSERDMIHRIFHEHPLSLIPETRMAKMANCCYGCFRYFLPGEAAYGCSDDKCIFRYGIHEECLEMGREIRHPLHPSHLLTQLDLNRAAVGVDSRCAVCGECSYGLGYICSQGCDLWIHLRCAVGGAAAAVDEQVIKHPSHPLHELRFLRRKKRSCSFECDACGTTQKGNSYICIICQYWIHESCAALQTTACFHHHHHDLSLAFRLPSEYIYYEYTCDICKGALRLNHWVYHCHLCRYIAHINCATNTTSSNHEVSNEDVVDDPKGIIHFPIMNDDMYEELIRAFVVRERGERETVIPHEENEIITRKYQFHYHHHPLRLTISTSSSFDSEEEEDDDDDDDCIGRSELRCDGCTTPIHHEKKQKASSSSSSSDYYYMSCDECKYFLHLACFNLPLELPSLPLHSIKDHKLELRNSGKLTDWTYCYICNRHTNGLSYACSECNFKVDIKCASLPDTIKHAGHPQHQHFLKLVTDNHMLNICGACNSNISDEEGFYKCDSCRFSVCCECVLLPAVNKHGSEKHWLPLTYDASVNHPGQFYCDSCEDKMNPKSWMYHCRDCDQSFHPNCFPATSGRYRNINFGRQQCNVNVITTCHHTLRFQLITKKKRCDLCHQVAYGELGFQCALCNFVMCFESCGTKRIKAVNAID